MPTRKTQISKKAAEEALKRFFSGSPDSDQVSVEEVFRAAGRQNRLDKANLAWLSNKLTSLRRHNLIYTEYYYGDRRRLEAISLTAEGKRALGRFDQAVEPKMYSTAGNLAQVSTPPTTDDALAIIAKLKQRYPELDIALTIKTSVAK